MAVAAVVDIPILLARQEALAVLVVVEMAVLQLTQQVL
jgi:hypothetical protein